jgi:steroid delta-isomerase-like uncharacterized protein
MVVALASVAWACADDDDSAAFEANKALHRQVFEAVSRGDMAFIDQTLSPDFVYHGAAGQHLDLAAAREMIGGYATMFPGMSFQFAAQVAEGEFVASRFTVTGTHSGDTPGLPATGKTLSVTGISIIRIVGGLIVEEWENFDELNMLRQLGVIAEPQEEPEM